MIGSQDSLLRIALTSALLISPVAVPAAMAQDSAEAIEEVVVTGSRRAGRSATQSAVPVDVLTGDDIANQGTSDMDDMLRNLLPSYNVSRQPISDAATLTRPATLRGLPPDNTLILINGKRRHRGAVIAELGGSLAAGSQGPDLAMIPGLAIERVEVLRDGAAAQYGSDAIAGVINFILKDNPTGLTFEGKYGEFYEDSEDLKELGVNLGMPLGDNGFANATLQWSESEPTSRSVQRDDAAGLIADGNDDVRQPYAQIWGAPEIKDDWAFFFNSGIELSDNQEIYGFGNYGERKVDGGFFFRNPNSRSGVFTSGSATYDLNGNGNPVLDPDEDTGFANVDLRAIMDTANVGQGGPSGCAAVPSPGSSTFDGFNGSAYQTANPGCFIFNSLDEGGFTPQFGGKVEDISGVAGVRGSFDSGLEYDVSISLGRNEIQYQINNTLNPSLGPASPRDFDLGKYIQTEQNYNADFVYPLELDIFYSPLNVAWGVEYRDETFEIRQGSAESWEAGDYAFQGSNGLTYDGNVQYDVNGDGGLDTVFTDGLALAGMSIGANGFAGFSPSQVGEFDRANWAGYLDLETDVTERWTVGMAVRYEDFDDFGDTTNGKISTRYAITDDIAVRGSYSTGFRAPTPGQSNVTKVSTITVNGELQQRGQIPPDNPLAQAFGGEALKEEEATNYTLGAVWDITDSLSLTVDYFRIEMDDRISQTGTIDIADEDINDYPNLGNQCPGINSVPQCLQDIGVPGAADLSSISFYTNDFETTTQGVDVIATYVHDWDRWGLTNFTAAWNWTETEVDDAGSEVSRERVAELENYNPENRGIFTINHMIGNFRFMTRFSYYDEFTNAADTSDDPNVVNADGSIDNTNYKLDCNVDFTAAYFDKCYDDEWIVDVEASYTLDDRYTFTVGAQNVLDESGPKDLDNGDGVGSGNKYDTASPFGFDGGFWYMRVRADFQ
jgi:iron complex outermembrane receptor protein